MVVREKEDEAEMVTETGKAHAGIDPEIISLASSPTEEGARVRAVLAQKAMRRTQAMAGDDTHDGKVAYRMEDDLDLPREIADAHGRKNPDYPVECSIRTPEGEMDASLGDYIIRGVKDELYPCKPDVFEATYEEVRDE